MQLSFLQATLEFVRCPGINGRIFGKEKYDLYGHGGLLFMSSTSLFLAMVSHTMPPCPIGKTTGPYVWTNFFFLTETAGTAAWAPPLFEKCSATPWPNGPPLIILLQ